MSIYDINQQELDQALEVYEAVGDARDKWRIRDEEGANKYMRIVRSIDAQAQEAQEVKRKEVARIEGFYDAQIDEMNSKAEFFRQLLVDWYNRQRAANPKYQLKTPWGKESIRKADLKKAMNEADGHYIDPATGEIVPGVEIVEKVSVTVKTE